MNTMAFITISYLCHQIYIPLNIQAETYLPTNSGEFVMYAFSDKEDDPIPHLALVHKELNKDEPVAIRIHSECLTGDLLGSLRCDCGEQLERSLHILNEQKGVLIYLRQEGRGIGLINKMKAYQLQDEGLNTIEANVHLGFEPDQRVYDQAVEMLQKLGISRIKLITNNPEKLTSLDDSPIEVVERIPIIIPSHEANRDYLKVKKDQMGHML